MDFLIGLRLIDLGALRRLAAARPDEFAIAVLAAVSVVVLGVTYGIVLAVIASVIDHLRHTYHPRNSVLGRSRPPGTAPSPGSGRTSALRGGAGDLPVRHRPLLRQRAAASGRCQGAGAPGRGGPLQWLVLDSAGIGDVDFTAGSVLLQVIERLHQRHVRFVVTSMRGPVRCQLDRYGIRGVEGQDAYYDAPGEAVEAYSVGSQR